MAGWQWCHRCHPTQVIGQNGRQQSAYKTAYRNKQNRISVDVRYEYGRWHSYKLVSLVSAELSKDESSDINCCASILGLSVAPLLSVSQMGSDRRGAVNRSEIHVAVDNQACSMTCTDKENHRYQSLVKYTNYLVYSLDGTVSDSNKHFRPSPAICTTSTPAVQYAQRKMSASHPPPHR